MIRPIGSTFEEFYDTGRIDRFAEEYLDIVRDTRTVKVTYEVVGHGDEYGIKHDIVKEIDRRYL